MQLVLGRPFFGLLCYVLGTKLVFFAVAHVPQNHALCDWRVCWPQDVANMRNKLTSLSFSRVSEVTLGPFFRVPSLSFGHENRWWFAVAHVPQSHALCYWRVCWPQDVANMRNKLKSLSFSRVSEGTLGPFFGFLCNVLPFFWGPLLRFGHEISFFCCCDWRVCWPQDVANRQSKFLGSAAGRQPLNKKIKHLKSISNI